MRILIVGAGAIGGYFGARLLQAGRDVTFLVRPRRAAQLAETGLSVKSSFGDVHIGAPPTILATALSTPYDLILLSCKAYDLEDAMESFTPAVGLQTAILPVLNGMRHLQKLDARFGATHVLGGECLLAATLGEHGEIVHLNDMHTLVFGERAKAGPERTDVLQEVFRGALFVSRASPEIVLEMWEKWVFLATLAGITCLMRSSIGDIVAADGASTASALLDECRAIAERAGYAPRPEAVNRMMAILGASGSPLTASMMRDVERNARVEADHVIGDLLARAPEDWPVDRSILRLAYVNLKAYELRRERSSPA
jgi:2-dehydropantoate 2-reductase